MVHLGQMVRMRPGFDGEAGVTCAQPGRRSGTAVVWWRSRVKQGSSGSGREISKATIRIRDDWLTEDTPGAEPCWRGEVGGALRVQHRQHFRPREWQAAPLMHAVPEGRGDLGNFCDSWCDDGLEWRALLMRPRRFERPTSCSGGPPRWRWLATPLTRSTTKPLRPACCR